MNELQRIQAWYSSQCNGDWEHTYGVRIETLDNPGWMVSIDITETVLEKKHFEPISRDSLDGTDWIDCKAVSGKFVAAGGAVNLTELLEVFLEWAEM